MIFFSSKKKKKKKSDIKKAIQSFKKRQISNKLQPGQQIQYIVLISYCIISQVVVFFSSLDDLSIYKKTCFYFI